MIKNIVLFFAAFAIAAAVTLAVRTARHDPHVARGAAPATAAAPVPAAAGHAGHAIAAPAASAPTLGAPVSTAPVNTICPICGMEVDPLVPTATYQGKIIGFGCGACPPRFSQDPERWGPAALKNEVAR